MTCNIIFRLKGLLASKELSIIRYSVIVLQSLLRPEGLCEYRTPIDHPVLDVTYKISFINPDLPLVKYYIFLGI